MTESSFRLAQPVYRFAFIIGSIYACICAGCNSPAILPENELPDPPTQIPVSSPTANNPLPTPTAVLAISDPTVVEEASPVLAPTPEPVNPLEFSFPTAGPEPVNFWRPPLYPVPWEPSPHDHFYLTRPIGADDVNWPLARYRYGYLLYLEPHTGIDIPAPINTQILAAGPGKVIHAGYGLYLSNNSEEDPYGIAVAIEHDFGYQGKILYTVYGHMNQVFVYPGQHVETGEVIGMVGETGRVSGPHLHFEVRLGDHTFFGSRNPELWISPPQGWGVLVGRVVEPNGRKINQAKVKLINQLTDRIYEVITYAKGSVNSDEYYNENLVLGDLPAGPYTVFLLYDYRSFKTEINIRAGEVAYFTFGVRTGFSMDLPLGKGSRFLPPDLAATPASVQFNTAP